VPIYRATLPSHAFSILRRRRNYVTTLGTFVESMHFRKLRTDRILPMLDKRAIRKEKEATNSASNLFKDSTRANRFVKTRTTNSSSLNLWPIKTVFRQPVRSNASRCPSEWSGVLSFHGPPNHGVERRTIRQSFLPCQTRL